MSNKAFDRAQSRYDNMTPSSGPDWDGIDVRDLTKSEKANPYEMEHNHCGVWQLVEVYNRGWAVTTAHCQHCGEELDIDSKILDEITESMGRYEA